MDGEKTGKPAWDAGKGDGSLVEKLVCLVKDTKQIKLEDAERALGVDEETAMKIAGILSEHDIIKVSYTIVGETVFVPGANIDKKPEESIIETIEKNPEKNAEDKTEKVDKLVEEIRRRILEKKYSNHKEPPGV